MFPLAIYHAVTGAWPLVLGNLAVSAAVAIGILHHHGELRRHPSPPASRI